MNIVKTWRRWELGNVDTLFRYSVHLKVKRAINVKWFQKVPPSCPSHPIIPPIFFTSRTGLRTTQLPPSFYTVMRFSNKYIASTDPNFWWDCWLVPWMTTDHSLHLINVIFLIFRVFSGKHYGFVFWFLWDSSGLSQTEWQSQDLNRNYFTAVFQLTRDKLTPKITSTPFLPHIPTKGRNTQPLVFFFDVLYK